jgi:hypothetical protein
MPLAVTQYRVLFACQRDSLSRNEFSDGLIHDRRERRRRFLLSFIHWLSNRNLRAGHLQGILLYYDQRTSRSCPVWHLVPSGVLLLGAQWNEQVRVLSSAAFLNSGLWHEAITMLLILSYLLPPPPRHPVSPCSSSYLYSFPPSPIFLFLYPLPYSF